MQRFAVLDMNPLDPQTPPAPGERSALVVVDMQDGEVWIPVFGVGMVEAMAEVKGRFLSDEALAAFVGHAADPMCMAPISWVRSRAKESARPALDHLAAVAVAAARRAAGEALH